MSEFRSFRGSKWSRGGLWTLTIEAWRLKMEPWRVFSPVVEIRITLMRSRIHIGVKMKRWIRIRIKVMGLLLM
jgi:hypothetical protein